MKKVVLSMLMLLLLSFSSYAQNEAYTTSDSWSQTLTASGVKASTQSLDLWGGSLKLGLTTRANLKASEKYNSSTYQYVRARLSDVSLLDGTISINLNLRGAYNTYVNNNPNEYYVFYSSFNAKNDKNAFDFRLYQANVIFDNVLKNIYLALGRIYLDTFSGYKIDGANISYDVLGYAKVYGYYGLPVSYYTDLNTQLVGVGVDIPIEASGTRVRGEYSYFIDNSNKNLDTQVVKARIDQPIPTGTVYLEGQIIGKAVIYDTGVDGYFDSTRTGYSVYIMGQNGENNSPMNPYIGLYNDFLGNANYIMAGGQVSQGITDYLQLELGYEGKFAFKDYYSDRTYHRIMTTINLPSLIHKNNFLSVVADYYIVPEGKMKYNNKNYPIDSNDKLLVGLKTTQTILPTLDLWFGVNVMNYQYRGATILTEYNNDTFKKEESRNNTLAYIGGMWKITDWCMLQLDYTFEYASIFKNISGSSTNIQIVEAWVNFTW